MPHLLHVEASPRKQRSASLEVARAFIEDWRGRHPDATLDTLDVWTADLPPFDGPALDAKYAGLGGQELDAGQKKVWDEIRALADRFFKADVILISTPMWNFGIPYRLKHLVDAISQKDILFTFDERGLNGRLRGRRGVVVNARGFGLGPDFPPGDYDFQSTYLGMWFKMVGITDVEQLHVEKTLMGPDADHASREQGAAQARELAGAY